MSNEYIDVLTEAGEPTGQSLPRNELHAKGLWHRVINVLIINSHGEVLLQKRAQVKESFPGYWDTSSSGHISAGDSSLESAQRETEEEVGIRFELSEFEYIGESKSNFILYDGKYIDNEIVDIYIVQKDLDIQSFHVQEEEVEEVKWVPLNELKRMIETNADKLVPSLTGSTYERILPMLYERFQNNTKEGEGIVEMITKNI